MIFQGKKKYWIFGGVLTACVIIFAVTAWMFFNREVDTISAPPSDVEAIKADERTATLYKYIEDNQKEIAQGTDEVVLYTHIGTNWKQIYDFTRNPEHLDRSIAVYEKGIEITGGQGGVLLVNAATVYKMRGDYEKSAQLLRQAIEISPGDVQLYVRLVELMQGDLNSEHEEIIDLYKKGLDTLIDKGPLVHSLAEYLKGLGRYKEALDYYRLLDASYGGFELIISELEEKIKEN